MVNSNKSKGLISLTRLRELCHKENIKMSRKGAAELAEITERLVNHIIKDLPRTKEVMFSDIAVAKFFTDRVMLTENNKI